MIYYSIKVQKMCFMTDVCILYSIIDFDTESKHLTIFLATYDDVSISLLFSLDNYHSFKSTLRHNTRTNLQERS